MTEEVSSTGGDAMRVPGYDLARGLAVLAMVMLNFRGVLAGSQVHPGWLDLAFELLDRRAAAALMMISGAGITLYARALWNQNRRKGLFLRGIFLILAGSLLSLIWSGDILHVYGVLICMGAVLVHRSRRTLACIALLFFAGGAARWLPLFEVIEEGGGTWIRDGAADLFFTGYFPLFPWAALFITGMLLGRLDMGQGKVRRLVWALGALGLTSAGATLVPADWFRMDLSLPTLPAMVSGAGTGLCLILAAFWISEKVSGRWCQYAAAAGRTSMTFYILHILVIVALAPLAGSEGVSDLIVLTLGALSVYSLYAGAAVWWLARVGRGPLEQAMRGFPFIRPVPRRPELSSPAGP